MVHTMMVLVLEMTSRVSALDDPSPGAVWGGECRGGGRARRGIERVRSAERFARNLQTAIKCLRNGNFVSKKAIVASTQMKLASRFATKPPDI